MGIVSEAVAAGRVEEGRGRLREGGRGEGNGKRAAKREVCRGVLEWG